MDSKYGVRISNYQAGSIYGVMQGIRKNYDYKKAVLANSLFLDYLISIGLDIYKGTATREVIGIESNYGTRSYEEEIAHLESALSKADTDEKKERIQNLIDEANENKDKFEKTSKERIREIFYQDGVTIYYDKGETVIHYRMLYRSAAKAKKGICMYICDRLYEQAHNYLWMGIKLEKKNAPIVEIGAYASLISSTIIDKIQINPDDVLILKDVDSFFKTNVISIETDKDRHCYAKRRNNYEVMNEIFDGQALIDLSIFPEYGNGFVLLRQHFTKAAAFATDIQGFFRDYFGNEYDTAVVKDMWGNFHKVKDIKVITTNNAVKWIKFGVTYEYWKEIVRANGSYWGIVKTAHESKLGDFQRMSYQMVNTLSEEIMEDVIQPSKNYIRKLKSDTPTFIDYLRRASTFSNDYDVLVALYEQDHTFEQCDYFRSRKAEIISTYVQNLKNGRLIQNADNMTIVQSPYALLLHSVGEDVENDPTLVPEDGCIQCYAEKFEHGEYLAGFRSPYNSHNNCNYMHNNLHPLIKKYFRLGTLCIAVNCQHTDFQPRNNGSDADGDSLYVTNKASIVEHSNYCYNHCPTVVNNIPEQKIHYDNELINFAKIDNQIASSQLAIGGSSNLAQIAQSYSYTFTDSGEDYEGIICALAVIAQVAIDSSKRLFDIDINAEIDRIKTHINVKENGFPVFWKVIATNTKKRKELNGDKIDSKINLALKCPMNHVYRIATEKQRPSTPTLPIKDFFVQQEMDLSRRVSKRIEGIISQFSVDLYNYNTESDDESDEYLLLREDFDELIAKIREATIPSKYAGLFSWLINRAFLITPGVKQKKNMMQSTMNKNKSVLLKALFEANPEALLKCFSANVRTTSKN